MDNDNVKDESQEQKVPPEKLKWYLSIPVLLVTTVIFFPIAIVLYVLRVRAAKKTNKVKSTVVYGCCVAAFVALIFSLGISYESKYNKIDEAIASGQYETAYDLLEQEKRASGLTPRLRDLYVKYYSEQGLYDEAADVMITYLSNQRSEAAISEAIGALNSVKDSVSQEKLAELEIAIADGDSRRQVIADAVAKEKAEKEAAEQAEKKAAAEAEAKEKAEKEAEKQAADKEKAEKEAEKRAAAKANEQNKADNSQSKQGDEGSNAIANSDSNAVSEKSTAVAYRYTGDEMKKIFTDYTNKRKDSDKKKLAETDPKEVYEYAVFRLKSIYSQYNSLSSDSSYKAFAHQCDVYIELFGSYPDSAKIIQAKKYADQIYNAGAEKNALIKKYDSEEYLLDLPNLYFTKDFYVINRLNYTRNSSTLENLLSELTSAPDAFAATSDYTYNELFGYLPGETYCVVRPTSEYEFPKQGLYTLMVIMDGETTVVDEQGFKQVVPVYHQVSNDFIDGVNTDINRYNKASDDIIAADASLRDFFGI